MIKSPRSLDRKKLRSSNPKVELQNADDLEVGDILFFMDALGIPTHVAVYAGKRNKTHFITHGVSEPYNSIMTTRLRGDFFPYQVMRCKDASLALNVAFRMNRWCKFQIPFSRNNHDFHIRHVDKVPFCHPKTGPASQSEYAQEHYVQNFFKYVEYAAHPDCPFYPDSPMEGFYCSEAIVAAYQVEALRMLGAVNHQDTLGVHWISDKTDLSYEQMKGLNPPKGYQQYYERVNSKKHGELSQNGSTISYPSFIAWNATIFGDDILQFAKEAKLPLKIDSLLSGPAAIFDYCLKHREDWIHCGPLKLDDLELPKDRLEENKEKWQKYVAQLFHDAPVRRNSTIGQVVLDNDVLNMEPIRPVTLRRRNSMPELREIEQNRLSPGDPIERHYRARNAKWLSPTKVVPKTVSDQKRKNGSSARRQLKF